MSSRDDHLRHFATYLNIASAGMVVAAVATAPISAVSSGKVDAWTLTGFVLLLIVGSLLLYGASHLILTWTKSS